MADHPEPATMHIGAVSARTGLSLRTLRHYDEIALVRPSGRTDGGFRLYTERDVERLLVIRRMKPLGFTLDQMADLLTITDTLTAGTDLDTATAARLGEYITAAHHQRAELATKLDMVDEFISTLHAHRGTRITVAPECSATSAQVPVISVG